MAIDLILQTIRDLITSCTRFRETNQLKQAGKNGSNSNSTPCTPVNDNPLENIDSNSDDGDDDDEECNFTICETRTRHHSDSRQDISYNRAKRDV